MSGRFFTLSLLCAFIISGCGGRDSGANENQNDPAPVTYTVTFDANAPDAEGEMEPQVFTKGQSQKLKKNAFTRPAANKNGEGTIIFEFSHWTADKDNPEEMTYGDEEEICVSEDMTLYAVWDEKEGCVASGTLITMADGSQKAVEEISVGDIIRTFDHDSGEISSSAVCDCMKNPNAKDILTLCFDEDTDVKIVSEHGFFDEESKKYVFINKRNVKDYIGHSFYNADKRRYLKLTGWHIPEGTADAYAIVTKNHLNHLSNGMLSMADGMMRAICNIFELDENMRVIADKKQSDIEKYGLFDISGLEYYSAEDFDNYNLEYMNIAVGKGFTTWEKLKKFAALFQE